MNANAWATAGFLGGSLVLLALPFVPALREWRRPTDATPLPVPSHEEAPEQIARHLRMEMTGEAGPGDGKPIEVQMSGGRAVYAPHDFHAGAGSSFMQLMAGGDVDLGPGSEVLESAHADGVLRLREGSTALRRIFSRTAIELERGCCFERLEAPLVRFGGTGAEVEPRPPAALLAGDWSKIAGAQRRNGVLVRVQGDCVLASMQHYEGSLVVQGDLCLEWDTVLRGDVKVTGDVLLQSGARVHGAVICDGDIRLLHGAGADGPVVCTSDVLLSAGSTIGSRAVPTTLSARGVIAETGAVAHGVVWAHRIGVVWESA